jgi:hypothetical protein
MELFSARLEERNRSDALDHAVPVDLITVMKMLLNLLAQIGQLQFGLEVRQAARFQYLGECLEETFETPVI